MVKYILAGELVRGMAGVPPRDIALRLALACSREAPPDSFTENFGRRLLVSL